MMTMMVPTLIVMMMYTDGDYGDDSNDHDDGHGDDEGCENIARVPAGLGN